MSEETNPPLPTKRKTISTSTPVAFALGTVIGVAGVLVTLGWKARDFVQIQADGMRETNVKLEAIRVELGGLTRVTWTLEDMERWAGRFRWENRDKNLIVNEPREAKR